MGLFRAICTSLLASVLSLGAGTASAGESALNVVVSFSILEDFARQVGGERIELKTIVGPDSDAHIYEPTPADVRNIAQADVVLINGLMFEGFLTRLIEASGSDADVITLTENAHILQDPQGGHYHYYGDRAVFHEAPNDPHAWQSVSNAKIYVNNIADAFCAADPAGCDEYQANQQRYLDTLTVLDNDIRKQLSALPEAQRTAVVAHHAFRYFENEYGFTFLAPQGMSTESEATAANVAGLIDALQEHKVAAVFAENISNPRLVEQIATEAGIPMGGTLYSDALSGQDGPAASYENMMRHNVETLVAALAQREP